MQKKKEKETPSRVLCTGKRSIHKQRCEANPPVNKVEGTNRWGPQLPKVLTSKGRGSQKKRFGIPCCSTGASPHTISLHPTLCGWLLVFRERSRFSFEPTGIRGRADILDGGPHGGKYTGFRGEGVNLIRALPNMAKQAWSARWCFGCNGA